MKKKIALILLPSTLLAFSLITEADVDITPAISVSTSYTDNLLLTPSDKENDLITDLKPSIRIAGEGTKLRHSLDYQMQYLAYAENHKYNETQHQYSLFANSEVVDNFFFINVGSNLTQQTTSLVAESDRFSLSPSADINDVFTHSINPYFLYAVDNTLFTRFSYRYSLTDYDEENLDNAIDTTNESIELTVASGPRFNIWSWSLDYTSDTEESDDVPQSIPPSFERIRFSNFYKVSYTISLIGIIGYEKNDYQTSSLSQETEGEEWQLGFRWTPSNRTLLEATAGERYYGDTFSLSLQHDLNRSNLSLSYEESVTTTNFLQSDILSVDASDSGLSNFTRIVPSSGVNAIIAKEFTARASTRLRRTTLSLQFSESQTENQQSLQETDVREINLTGLLDLNVRSRLEAQINWLEEDNSNGLTDSDEVLESIIGIQHRLGQNMNVEAKYSYADMDSTNLDTGYNRNIIHLSLNVVFR